MASECAVSAISWVPLVLLSLFCAREQHKLHRLAQRDITLVLAVSVLFRLVWFAVYDDHGDTLAVRILNRLSIMLQCTGVLMLLFMWLSGMAANKEKFLLYRNISIAVFAVLWIYIVIGSFFGMNTFWYRTNLITIGVISFLIAFIALCYGLIVQHKMKQLLDDEMLLSSDYPKRKRIARRLIIVSTVLSVCFGFRAVCFTIAHDYSPGILFPWFYYHVPEIIPLFTILIELSPDSGILMKLWRRLAGGGDDSRFSENSDYPRPTSNSITMTSVVMDMDTMEEPVRGGSDL